MMYAPGRTIPSQASRDRMLTVFEKCDSKILSAESSGGCDDRALVIMGILMVAISGGPLNVRLNQILSLVSKRMSVQTSTSGRSEISSK
jgi:hypothetical protein